ncbi:hypothetical protein, partial [Klebsiella pneumoniae]|uniref:hypothetical protein n=1 Tax=Klebsiella pneumoniae TaxID=573 RepID=UPI0019530623
TVSVMRGLPSAAQDYPESLSRGQSVGMPLEGFWHSRLFRRGWPRRSGPVSGDEFDRPANVNLPWLAVYNALQGWGGFATGR